MPKRGSIGPWTRRSGSSKFRRFPVAGVCAWTIMDNSWVGPAPRQIFVPASGRKEPSQTTPVSSLRSKPRKRGAEEEREKLKPRGGRRGATQPPAGAAAEGSDRGAGMVGLVCGGVGGRGRRLGDEAANGGGAAAEHMRRLHSHAPGENQCSSALVKHIEAPVHLVWSLVRSFDQPQRYKPFVSHCVVRGGDLEIGSLRDVNVKTGLPATTSTERLEQLDDDEHILSVKFVGGDHRLRNYSSIVTVHPESVDGRPGTLVIESFVVDVPDGNTEDETCYFVEAVIKCNLTSLAEVSQQLVVQ